MMTLRCGGPDGDGDIRPGPGNPIASDACQDSPFMCGCNTMHCTFVAAGYSATPEAPAALAGVSIIVLAVRVPEEAKLPVPGKGTNPGITQTKSLPNLRAARLILPPKPGKLTTFRSSSPTRPQLRSCAACVLLSAWAAQCYRACYNLTARSQPDATPRQIAVRMVGQDHE